MRRAFGRDTSKRRIVIPATRLAKQFRSFTLLQNCIFLAIEIKSDKDHKL